MMACGGIVWKRLRWKKHVCGDFRIDIRVTLLVRHKLQLQVPVKRHLMAWQSVTLSTGVTATFRDSMMQVILLGKKNC